jgi:hypothetical protein
MISTSAGQRSALSSAPKRNKRRYDRTIGVARAALNVDRINRRCQRRVHALVRLFVNPFVFYPKESDEPAKGDNGKPS